MSLENFSIIDSTLREGEQFVNAFFLTEQKMQIARLLDRFGVEYIELTTPLASPQSEDDIRLICRLGLNARILTHIRCNLNDAKLAVDTGVNGVDVVIGTSSHLRKFSHGKSIPEIINLAQEVFEFLRSQNVEMRFSTEDTLRSNPEDLFRVYEAVDQIGIDRVGIADTVGIGTPQQIFSLISELRTRIKADIEFHGHNDTGCAIANAHAALLAGATHIDTTVLGIGERNGITALEGLIARLYTENRTGLDKYNLTTLVELNNEVASCLDIKIPFNHYVTGFSAFTHKAGIHAKAVLNSPSTYEALNPEDFGLTRYIHIAHRLTRWNAVRQRAEQLGLQLRDEQVKQITEQIKFLSDQHKLSLNDVDGLLRIASIRHEEPAVLTGQMI